MQRILSYLRKAIENYNMIEEGDKIAVALSGGKDSITLLMGLKALQRFYPKKFELEAITVSLGLPGAVYDDIEAFCNQIGVGYTVVHTDIGQIIFHERKEKNPCSLCANLRRGILNSTAIEHGCNKLALGHNEDDVLETFFLNMLYAGNLSTFAPVSYMDRSKVTLIRPLIYAPEKEIRKFIKRSGINVMKKNCPMDGVSKREDIKEMLYKLSIKIPNVRANLIGAIKRANINGWQEFK